MFFCKYNLKLDKAYFLIEMIIFMQLKLEEKEKQYLSHEEKENNRYSANWHWSC